MRAKVEVFRSAPTSESLGECIVAVESVASCLAACMPQPAATGALCPKFVRWVLQRVARSVSGHGKRGHGEHRHATRPRAAR